MLDEIRTVGTATSPRVAKKLRRDTIAQLRTPHVQLTEVARLELRLDTPDSPDQA